MSEPKLGLMRLYQITLEFSVDDAWIARLPGLPACMGVGDSINEALRELKDSYDSYMHVELIEKLQEHFEIPMLKVLAKWYLNSSYCSVEEDMYVFDAIRILLKEAGEDFDFSREN